MSDLDDISRARVQRQRRAENLPRGVVHVVESEIIDAADAIVNRILAEDYDQDEDGAEIVLQLTAMTSLRAAAVSAVVMQTLVNEHGVCYLDPFVDFLWKREIETLSEKQK